MILFVCAKLSSCLGYFGSATTQIVNFEEGKGGSNLPTLMLVRRFLGGKQ